MTNQVEALHARIAALCDENRVLRERIETMEDALTAEFDAWLIGDLTYTEGLILGFLAKRGKASKLQIHQYLYAIDPQGGAEPKIVDVWICKIRKKLPPGAEIRTLWGFGYELPPTSLEILRRQAA